MQELKQCIEAIVTTIVLEVAKRTEEESDMPKIFLDAGYKILNETKEPLQQMRSMLSTQDAHYFCDICFEVFGSINDMATKYYNGMLALGDGDELLEEAAIDRQTLQFKAKRIMIEPTQMLLNEIDNRLTRESITSARRAPVEVTAQNEKICKAVERCLEMPEREGASDGLLGVSTKALKTMKKRLGEKHPFYLERSSQVYDLAMTCIVKQYYMLQLEFYKSLPKSSDEDYYVSACRKVGRKAYELHLDTEIDIDDATRQFINDNYGIIWRHFSILDAFGDMPDYYKYASDGQQGIGGWLLGCFISICIQILVAILLAAC